MDYKIHLILPIAFFSAAVAAQETIETVDVIGKKEWALTNIPSSSTTVGSEHIEAMFSAGADISALSLTAPSLYVEGSNGRYGQRFYIRGLGNTDFDFSASQPVAVYSDGVVQESGVLRSFPLLDIKEVEILRGPQGSLYGRNSTAGAVLITTNTPTNDDEGYVKIAVGNYGATNLEAVLNTSLADNVFSRTAIITQNRDDWIDNAYLNDDSSLGGFNDSAIRQKILWEANDQLSALLELRARKLVTDQLTPPCKLTFQGSSASI